MKLVNPTDDELNAAFAEKVAGWTAEQVREHRLECGLIGTTLHVRENGPWNGPRFTESADAVLPWLEKAKSSFPCGSSNGSASLDKGIWAVAVPAPSWDDDAFCGEDKSFAKAAVLALLRAHGVEVEFTP